MPVEIPPQSTTAKAMTLDDVIQAWCKGIYEYKKALEEQQKRGEA
jgi:predicted transcriptional regulator of viral defense system